MEENEYLNEPVEEQTAAASSVPISSTFADHDFGDPDPPPEGATREEKAQFLKDVAQYAEEILDVLKQSTVVGEPLWLEFTSTFRPKTVQYIPKAMQLKWIHLLIERGVYVKRKQGYARSKALIECLEQTNFIATSNNPLYHSEKPTQHIDMPHDSNEAETTGPSRTVAEEAEAMEERSHSQIQSPLDATKANLLKVTQHFPATNTNMHEEKKPTFMETDTSRGSSEVRQKGGSSLGVTGLMKSYQGRKQYSGSWSDDLNSALELYDTLAHVCKLSEKEKAEAMPVMLRGDALSFFTLFVTREDSYQEITKKLRD